MIVTEIQPYQNARHKIYLDEKFAFMLYKGELQSYQLQTGMELSPEMYERILEKTLLPRAKKRVLHLLEKMARTEANVRQKLREGFYPTEVIDEAITYAKSFGYIDDRNYARSFAEEKMHSKSRREIFGLLLNKGIERDIINEVLTIYEDDEQIETKAIYEHLKKKRYDKTQATRAETQKMYGYLQRKGFAYTTIKRVLEYDDENEFDDDFP